MALQFSLASVNPAGLTKPIDFPGIEQKQLDVQQSRMNVAEQQRQTAEAAQTRGAFDEYLKQGGDLFTPAGLQKAATDLRGKIPASEYMKLGPALQKAQEADLKYRASLQKLNDEELAGQLGIFSTAGPQIDALYKKFEKTKTEEKGDVTARTEFDADLNKLVAQYGPIWGKSPYGQQALKTLSGITPEQVPMLNRMSGYSAAALKEEADRRQAELRAAQAKALEGGAVKGAENLQAPDGRVVANVPGRGLVYTDDNKPYERSVTELKPLPTARTGGPGVVEQYRTPDGSTYRVSTRTGDTEKVNADGTVTKVPSLPADATKIGARAQGASTLEQIKEQSDTKKFPPTEDEIYRAKQFLITGKMPSMGAGAGGQVARNRLMEIASQRATDLGLTPDEVVQLQKRAKSIEPDIAQIQKQDSNTRILEGNVMNALNVVEDVVRRIGGSDIKALRDFQAYAGKQLSKPEYTELTAQIDVIEGLARLYQGVTGAGGTAVAFLNLAKENVPANPSMGQVLALKSVLPKLIAARQKAVEEEQDRLMSKIALPAPKPGSPAAERAKAKPFGYKPGDEKSETPDYIRSRYDEFIAKMKDPKLTPTERDRYRRDAKEARDQLEAMKAPLPPLSDLSEPTTTAKPVAGDMQAQVTKAFGKYEPDVYEYRVSPEGKVQRRKK